MTRGHGRAVWLEPQHAADAAFESTVLTFADDYEGPVAVTMLRHKGSPANARRAVLWIHGYADYFFHEHVANHLASRGFAFFALDLRRYGRSLLPHQTPNYCRDLSEYFPEIEMAVEVITDQQPHTVTLLAHSLGGLVSSLWRTTSSSPVAPRVDSLVLNSPFLASPLLDAPPILRISRTGAVLALARVRPYAVLPRSGTRLYGPSLHRDSRGEWEYNVEWKPHDSFAIRASWLASVLRGQGRLRHHRGPDVQTLVMTSDRSARLDTWADDAMSMDLVLNVQAIRTEAGRWSRNPDMAVFDGAVHDVTLSRRDVRERALETISDWIAARRVTSQS